MNATPKLRLGTRLPALAGPIMGCLVIASATPVRAAPQPPIRPAGLGAAPNMLMPPSRPVDLTPQPAPLPPAPSDADNEALRAEILADGEVIGTAEAPIAGRGGCGIAAPLRLAAIKLDDGSKIALAPPVVIRAALAAVIADWVREDLAPARSAKGDQLAVLEGTGGYQCRSRDNILGAKLSQHGIGNAFDLAAFRTKKGKLFPIAAQTSESDDAKAFFAHVRETACARFMTVLGPGADIYHTTHLHLDLETRRHGTHLCQ